MSETRRLVQVERELLTHILDHLRELERRRLFGGHSSLFAYAIAVLGYSEDQAHRRISAMRLIRELPEIEAKIESGQINLSHVGIAHALFKNEKKAGKPLSAENKLDVFAALEGRTARDAQRVALSFATEAPAFRESIRPVGNNRNVVTIELGDDTLAKLERVKGLLAHAAPDLSWAELIDRMADVTLAELDPARPASRRSDPDCDAQIRRRVWQRDGGACVKCGSTRAVEEDHVIPESMGGAYTFENIRLLCRSCNLRAAIEVFGVEKMEPYTSPNFSRGRRGRRGRTVRSGTNPYRRRFRRPDRARNASPSSRSNFTSAT